MDEGGVGAVLEQAAHQIGQQFLVAADRGIGAHGIGSSPDRLGGVVQGLAHAVQALELDLHVRGAAPSVDGGERVGVVGGELRIERGRGVDQGAGADEIVEVGGGLGGEHRIVGTAGDLGALDLGVPIGALDQPHHDPAAACARPGAATPGDHLGRALLIGLNREAKAGPARPGRARAPGGRAVSATGPAGRPLRRRCVKLMSYFAAIRASRLTRG